jgi:hypothetical protein
LHSREGQNDTQAEQRRARVMRATLQAQHKGVGTGRNEIAQEALRAEKKVMVG